MSRRTTITKETQLGTGHKVQGGWAGKNWGWVTNLLVTKGGGSLKIEHQYGGGSR